MFGTITLLDGTVFNPVGEGRYVVSTYVFGSPSNYFAIKGGTLNKTKTLFTAAITRNQEKDVLVNGETQRLTASVQTILSIPRYGFTPEEVDVLATHGAEIITPESINYLMSGGN